jgi:hypothetical protein
MITRSARLAPALLLFLAGTALAGQRGQPDRAATPAMSDPPRACCPKRHEPGAEPFRSFPPFAVFGQPFVYLPPAPDSPPPAVIFMTPPAAYAPDPLLPEVAPPPTPPVEPAREVVLPTGRWELHGDGLTSRQVWVWVPAYHAELPRRSVEPAPPTAPPANP